MCYEILQRYIMLSAVAVRGTYEELEAYCARVANGYRPPLHASWPASVSKLIEVRRCLEPDAYELTHKPTSIGQDAVCANLSLQSCGNFCCTGSWAAAVDWGASSIDTDTQCQVMHGCAAVLCAAGLLGAGAGEPSHNG